MIRRSWSSWRRRAVAASAVAALGAAGLPAVGAQAAVAALPAVLVSEVGPTNVATVADETGDFGDWVELRNLAPTPVDLAGWGLSDSAKNPFRWVFPEGARIGAGARLVVWADKADRRDPAAPLHTSFSLDNGDDSVVLTAPDRTATGTLVDQVDLEPVGPDVSWCRMPEARPDAPFTACLDPTPGAANAGATAGGLLAPPTLSLPSGVYPGAVRVTATGPAGATLRYTTDGSEPTGASAVASGPLTVSEPTALRVRAFRAGRQPSLPVSATYVVGPRARFAGQRLLFVTMRPGDRDSFTAKGRAPAQGWRSAVELVAPDGTTAFAAEALTDDAGQAGSRQDQATMPLDIKLTDDLGTSSVDHPVFSARPDLTSFDRFRLRNSGDDYQEAHLRDQFWQAVGAQARLAPSASEPVQVFLNGRYHGLMDLRQREDETIVETAFDGVDADSTQFLNDDESLNGDTSLEDWAAVVRFIRNNDMSVAANYDRATRLLDVESFAQDFAIHLFAAARDWPFKNRQMYRMPDHDGRWRFRLHDFDIASDGTNIWGHDTSVSTDMSSKYSTKQEHGALMAALLASPRFRTLYANVIADQLSSVLRPQETLPLLDRFASAMEPYVPNQVATNGQPASLGAWKGEVARLRAFLTDRAPFYEGDTRAYLGLGARVPLTVGVSDPGAGTVRVNTLDLTDRFAGTPAAWTGAYWADVPVTLTAVPRPGFAFVRWSGSSTATTRTVTVPAGAGRTYRAVFAAVASTPAPTVRAVGPQTATTGVPVSLQVQASDPSGLPLTYDDKDLPAGVSVDPETGLVHGSPNRAGTWASTVTVSNGVTSTVVPIAWTVANALDRSVVVPRVVTGDGTGLTARWYDDDAFRELVATRVGYPAVDLGLFDEPVPGTGFSWSARWTGSITVPTTGSYTFRTTIRRDDGVRLWVGDRLVLDDWSGRDTAPTATVRLAARTPTPIRLEYRDIAWDARLSVDWTYPGQSAFTPLPVGVLTP